MGWAFCENSAGRPCGYCVVATCDHPACLARIDRGLDYVCGGMHDGGDYGCGLYFCPRHKTYATRGGEGVQLCAECATKTHEEDGDD